MSPSRRVLLRRRRLAVVSVLLVVVGGVGYVGATNLAPVPASAAALVQPVALTQPVAAPTWPAFGESAFGAVGFPGVLASSGQQDTVPIASITKMITALVILDAKPIGAGETGPDITFTAADVDIYYDVIAENGSVAPVVSGMVLTQRQAFEAMLLPSANNYAASLAVWAYGSVDNYLAAATTWLADNALTQTSVADTSGLSTLSVSSPADLVEIGKLVVGHPALAEIVALPSAVLPLIGSITNTNKLLGRDGVDGIKTGTTDVAGACLLFSTDFTVGTSTVTLVGVVLGGATHSELNSAISALIKSVQPGFHDVVLAEEGAVFGSYTTQWGDVSDIVAERAASVLVWSDSPITGAAMAAEVQLGRAGDEVGTVSFTIGAATPTTVTVPLELKHSLTDPGPAWRMGHPGELAAG
ncbi:MAG: D-alanyl-D-alanine carboxypeptidase [Cryobacterium sp.]|uniref:D-alanyl-D-alanine carboxypeptidase family protein n=1 Tax=unclassified Cryobacterium TaxID=2649013 RepID=UPI0018C9263D|nr:MULTISPECIES: D-alanyl-D-alanine carboxypeptidase [unclassified Cryobacterium]MCY7404336.1 D-alanyl-D-alanine carboxypeptidase [Cryobacterium sp.]MEC5154626.1 D-alanyl-D-alanine carboxypeptidase (penicillin-binding protein 5/6) [Cryobacterium sp. CAN_C3]